MMMTDKELEINVFDFKNEQDIKEKKKIIHYEKYEEWYIYSSLLMMIMIYLLSFFISPFLKSLGIEKEITFLVVFSLMGFILYNMFQNHLRKTKYQIKKMNEKISEHIIEQTNKIEEKRLNGYIKIQIPELWLDEYNTNMLDKFKKINLSYQLNHRADKVLLILYEQSFWIKKEELNDFFEFAQKHEIKFSVYP